VPQLTFNVFVLFQLGPCDLVTLFSYMFRSVCTEQNFYQERSTILVSFYFSVRYVVTHVSVKTATSVSFTENIEAVYSSEKLCLCVRYIVS
jgi:hypothetical protein